MDCYYHGHSGSPGGKCSECERERPTLTELERHRLNEAKRERRERMEKARAALQDKGR